MTNPLNPDPLHAHSGRVDLVAAAGVQPPAEWLRLRDSLKAFIELDATAMLAKLTSAVIDGAPADDVAVLRAAAYGEQQMSPKIIAHVRGAVARRMVEAYSAVAVENYAKVAKLFDAEAAKFVACAEAVDVDADGAEIVDRPDKVRKAWLDAEKHAHHLTKLLPALAAAASLAGLPESAHRDIGGRDAVLVPLCVDVTRPHRRKVWEAWSTKHTRCGRWSALHAANVPIRALPSDQLDAFEPYRKAMPLQEQLVPISPMGTYQNITVDPEDTSQLPPGVSPVSFKQLAR
jgi:hypothetical protein